jgi:hypothetical protein
VFAFKPTVPGTRFALIKLTNSAEGMTSTRYSVDLIFAGSENRNAIAKLIPETKTLLFGVIKVYQVQTPHAGGIAIQIRFVMKTLQLSQYASPLI